MIEPIKSGQELCDEIALTEVAPGTLAFWWLGQSGFLIKSSQGMLVIDPYLSEHLTTKYAGTDKPHVRMTRAPLCGLDLGNVDLVLCSHKHSDHMDPVTLPELMDAADAAVLALPAALVNHATSLGIDQDRMIGLVAFQPKSIAGFSIHPIPSAHETIDTDPQGQHLYLGFVIQAEGLTLYHSGDCVPHPDLVEWLNCSATSFDVLLLPMNGRDPARGVAGNMSASEAVDLANVIRPRYLIPHHYDMFTFNTVPIDHFLTESKRLHHGISPIVLQAGDRWILSPS